MLLNIHWAFLSKFVKNPKSPPKIIGISDGHLMEKILKKVYQYRYQNYHFHQDPKLDITQVPSILHSTADIISCSEVLEHVAPPVKLAFLGLRMLLKKKGVLILSVPYSDAHGKHIEHFPEMSDSELLLGENPRLRGKLVSGEIVEFTNLIFHGGEGSTLEYRIFSSQSLREHLLMSGFTRCKGNRNIKAFGIFWEDWSRVCSVK